MGAPGGYPHLCLRPAEHGYLTERRGRLAVLRELSGGASKKARTVRGTPPNTRPGDLWCLGRHRLLCGDATSAADVQRLLKEKPKAVGIAVPSMPPGSPGMESAKPMPYETLLVKADGSTSVFARH